MKKMQKSTAVALCGVIAALCIVLMLLSGLIQIASIAIPALCGILLIVIVLELSAKWALCVYAAVSVISLLLVADKEAAVMFAAFFGYYPILKAKLDPIVNHSRLRFLHCYSLYNDTARRQLSDLNRFAPHYCCACSSVVLRTPIASASSRP